MNEKSIKFDELKPSPELIAPTATIALSEVLKHGKDKYAARNWEKGMEWDRIIGALKRHLTALENGKDYDNDSKMLHSAHILTNAMFLNEYYRIFPQGDRIDRLIHPFMKKRIALDIDGVLANFNYSFGKKMGKNPENDITNWYYSYKVQDEFPKIKEDKDFWINMPTYFDYKEIGFEPYCYITHRPIPVKWTQEWIENQRYACAPVYSVVHTEEKVPIAKKLGIEIMVEDKFENFINFNDNGILCFLITRPWNEKFDVGHLRIKKLNDIFEYRLKK